jgi:hypothetical protein
VAYASRRPGTAARDRRQFVVEIEGKGSTLLKAGEAGIIPAELVHLARNESASANGKALVVHSRAAKDKPLIVVVKK